MRSLRISRCSFAAFFAAFLSSFSKGFTPNPFAVAVAAFLYSRTIWRKVETSIVFPPKRGSPALNIFRIESSTLIFFVFFPTEAKRFSSSRQFFAALAASSPFSRKLSRALSFVISLTTRLIPYFFFAKKPER